MDTNIKVYARVIDLINPSEVKNIDLSGVPTSKLIEELNNREDFPIKISLQEGQNK